MYIPKILGRIVIILNVILTVLDVVSDIVLAVDYCVTDNPWWCGLTSAFIALPFIVAIILLIISCWFIFDHDDDDDLISPAWKYWKGLEICFESGPQLLLQLYIMAITDLDPLATSGTSTFLTIIQAAAIVTSFLSLSFGCVTFRQVMEEDEAENTSWTWKDMVVDMVWNTLSISSRVIALALFASFELYWFWGLVITQVGTVIIGRTLVDYHQMPDKDSVDFIWVDFIIYLIANIFSGFGWIFNILASFNTLPFPVYLLYWTVMFIENTVMISLWHQWSDDRGVWYHDLALLYVIIAYSVSLIIKSVHSYFYKPNQGEKNIFKWKFIFVKEDKKEEEEVRYKDTTV